MAYRTRSARRLARKSKKNLFATILVCLFLIYATIFWILPNVIGGLGFLNSFLKPSKKTNFVSEGSTLAPPVLNIPYESTNSSQIDIRGFATAHSRVKMFLDDEMVSDEKVNEDGSFTAINIDLRIGTNNIFGKTVDEKNHESLPSKTIRLVFDNEKPSLEVTEPEDGKIFQAERKIKVSGKTEPGSKVLINDTQAIVSSDGTFSSNYGLNDGDNNLTIKAMDKASNINEISRKITFQP